MRKSSNAAFIILLITVFNYISYSQILDSSGQSNNLSETGIIKYPSGLGLIISFMPYYSRLSDESMRNYALTVGLSYTFSSRIASELRFYTGEEVLADRNYLPVKGKLLLGAGDIIIRSYLANLKSIRFYCGVGLGLQTILTGNQKGYNGYGLLAYAGAEYLISRAISISTQITYKRCYYTTFVNGGTWNWLNPKFTDNWLGLDIDLNVYFR